MVDRLMAIGLPLGEEAIHARLRLGQPDELAEWLLGRSPAYEAAWMEAPKADARAILLSITSLERLDLRQMLEHLAIPGLLVYGQNDPAVQAPGVELLASLPQQVHMIFFDQSGHFPMLDEPAKFNRLLSEFLSLSSGESPRQLQLKEEWKRRVR
jgi:pimeloyl-ACP methyl ester carboxylesterase